MKRDRTLGALLVAAITLFAMTPARAAKLTKVTADWKGGASGFSSDVSMYIYVPDKVAKNPPLLTLIHYCGGSASAVFGQASTVIKVVDQNGIVVVAPDNGARCWDVQTTKSLTRDGGGDSHAIKQMVLYALKTYNANPDRVYATGDSSGGMTTQLLLALYPDIFKGGASFAGIPAGCRVGNETGDGYSGSCAGGNISKTAQEWGDLVRKMGPANYAGHRPRVQLFHGDKDQYINYKVHAEAIKEWGNVLGLDPTKPTSTSTVTLGSHQATRQTWKNDCGFVVLDAFMSLGGDHGPSDTLFNSYVPPFLGLDKTGDVDPEIEQCGTPSGTGGAMADGGAGGTGGADGSAGGSGGAVATGGSRSGGAVASGGATSSGGNTGGGGAQATGGDTATGGSGSTGGDNRSGGSAATGGNQATGGSATGGSKGSGGAMATGGNASTGGSTTATGGSPSTGGSGSTPTTKNTSSGGCAFGTAPSQQGLGWTLFGLGLVLSALARRRRR